MLEKVYLQSVRLKDGFPKNDGRMTYGMISENQRRTYESMPELNKCLSEDKLK